MLSFETTASAIQRTFQCFRVDQVNVLCDTRANADGTDVSQLLRLFLRQTHDFVLQRTTSGEHDRQSALAYLADRYNLHHYGILVIENVTVNIVRDKTLRCLESTVRNRS